MSWSYSSSASNLDQVRRLIWDVDTTMQLLSDEEINAELSLNSSDPIQTAKKICIMLAAKFSRKAVSKSAGKYSEDLRSIASEYRKQADMLQEMGAEPWDEIAEQTFGPLDFPWQGWQEKEYVLRDMVRNGF